MQDIIHTPKTIHELINKAKNKPAVLKSFSMTNDKFDSYFFQFLLHYNLDHTYVNFKDIKPERAQQIFGDDYLQPYKPIPLILDNLTIKKIHFSIRTTVTTKKIALHLNITHQTFVVYLDYLVKNHKIKGITSSENYHTKLRDMSLKEGLLLFGESYLEPIDLSSEHPVKHKEKKQKPNPTSDSYNPDPTLFTNFYKSKNIIWFTTMPGHIPEICKLNTDELNTFYPDKKRKHIAISTK